MPIITANGLELSYQIDGDGPETLVLVNGLADNKESWEAQIPAFSERYRVISFDNRGIGESPTPPGPYTTADMAEDLAGLVDALGVERFHLLGVSMGGMIAQEFAIAYPEVLRSVTLGCTYAAPGEFCSRMFDMWGDLAPKLGVPFVMRDVTLWAFTVPFFEEHTDDVREFEAAMAELAMPVDAYLSQLNVIQQHDTTDRLGGISTPTLVLAGEEDILIPVRLSRRLHDGISGAQWATVPGGHACLWESPDPFNNAVIDFVKEHSS
jgi:3-oxoadipate enol-lactonase